MSKIIYGVFNGVYEDWECVGYFESRLDADKYCALEDAYYVVEIASLEGTVDLSNVTLNYAYKVYFCRNKSSGCWELMDNDTEPLHPTYRCYQSDRLRPDHIDFDSIHESPQWIRMEINTRCEDLKLAMKTAQDYLDRLLTYNNGIVNFETVETLNTQLIHERKTNIKEKPM